MNPTSFEDTNAEDLTKKLQTSHHIEEEFAQFIHGLQEHLAKLIPKIQVLTELRRNNAIFRANPDYRKNVWRDWALINWSEEGNLPCKFWGFVDLLKLPNNTGINYGSCDLQPGVYAIVESASYNLDDNEVSESDLFVPLLKDSGGFLNGNVTSLKFYLADVEAIVKPIVVIPDIGGAGNVHFLLKDRIDWKKDFIKWLRAPHYLDNILDEFSDDSEEEVETSANKAKSSGLKRKIAKRSRKWV